MFGVGEVVRVKSRSDLGEIPIVAIQRDAVFIDTGWRIEGVMVSISWPKEDLISLEEYPAWLKNHRRQRRLQTQDSVQRQWNNQVRGAA